MQKIELTDIVMRSQEARYYNKTMLYLVPCMRMHAELPKVVGTQYVITSGIDDLSYSGSFQGCQDQLFLLFHLNQAGNEFLDSVRTMQVYRDDYLFADLITSRLHMIIFEFPLIRPISHFKKSEYSKMYSISEIKELYSHFNTRHHWEAMQILLHNENGRAIFEERLEKYLERIAVSKQLPEYMMHGWRKEKNKWLYPEEMEYDFPLSIEQEIFNYSSNVEYPHESFITNLLKNEQLAEKIKATT